MKPLNWRKELKKKEIDWERLGSHQDWKYCAIGERREILTKHGIKFWPIGMPDNSMFFWGWGIAFTRAIIEKDKKRALEILDKIDARIAGMRRMDDFHQKEMEK